MRALFVGCVLVLGAVGAFGCVHAQAGPLIGVSSHGPVVGIEGGAGAGVLSGSLGAEVRPFGERSASLYVAAEPGLAVPMSRDANDDYHTFLSGGGTIGYSADEHGQGALLLGGWGAVPWVTSGDCRGNASAASVSIGVHLFQYDGELVWTVYASPKLALIQDCPDFRFVSQ